MESNAISALKQYARKSGGGSHSIMTNETIERIVSIRPTTFDALGKIKGVGKVILEKHGQAILDILKNYPVGVTGTNVFKK
jgi:superfamily II DNA helicase RecQ